MSVYEISQKLTKTLNRLALGYEESFSFSHGYLLALHTMKLISKKDYNNLITVYASIKNENCDYFITKDGKLGKHPE